MVCGPKDFYHLRIKVCHNFVCWYHKTMRNVQRVLNFDLNQNDLVE